MRTHPTLSRRSLLLLVSLLLAWSLVACGEEAPEDEDESCPFGTTPFNGECLPISYVDTSSPTPDAKVEVVADTTADGTVDDGATTADGGEVATPYDSVEVPAGQIGASCKKDNECEGSTICLDWPGGYCTALNCSEGTCPDDALCLPILMNSTGCFMACESHTDCRLDKGYQCKGFPDGEGGLQKVCHGVDEEAGALGDGCLLHEWCQGSMICLDTLPGGYCTNVYCDDGDPCPDGSSCVTFNSMDTCMQSCSSDDECHDGLACKSIKNVDKELVDVCTSAAEPAAIGEQCISDAECLSGYCHIYSKGTCLGSSTPCVTSEDCPNNTTCEVKEHLFYGACTQTCKASKPCPAGSYCVSFDGYEGECSVTCGGAGVLDDCRSELGWECMWGDPIASTLPSGLYLCADFSDGSTGTSCLKGEDCDSGSCLLDAVEEHGYCYEPCGAMNACPFPMRCAQMGGVYQCLKSCNSDKDCPANFACEYATGTATKVCLPE